MFAVIDPDLFNILLDVGAPFTFPAFKFSSLSATNKPILFVAFAPIFIVPPVTPVVAPVSPKGPNSTVFVPTSPEEAKLPIVSFSPFNTGIVGTAAYIPTAFSTLSSFPPGRFWLGPWDNEAVVPILIVPPTLTSCISWSIPTPTLLSPLIFIVPELYTPLVYLLSLRAERPISPPGRTLPPVSCLWAFKLYVFLLYVVLSISIVSSSITPGLNTVIIPKLPLESILISFWLSAFIKTLP